MPESPPAPSLRPRPRMRWGLFLLAFVLGVILDLGTKDVAFAWLREGYGCPNHAEVFTPRPNKVCPACDEPLTKRGSESVVTSWFSFKRATNPGAAFGMFRGQHTFFMLVTVAAFVAVPFFVHTARRLVVAAAIVLGLILAGVFGNFWDRVLFGEVRDFLDLHAPQGGGLSAFLGNNLGADTWPTFNVADMFITGGAIGILGSQFFLKDEEKPKAPEAGPAPAPEAEPEPAPEAEAEPAPEAEAGPAPEAEAEPAPEAEPEPEADPEPAPEAEAEPAPEAEPEPEAKGDD